MRARGERTAGERTMADVPLGSGPELSRKLGVYAVFTTATGTMIGAGIFILPGIAAEAAGPGAALSFLFAGCIALVTALSACELATAMPRAGGPYFFVSRAMGSLFGAIVGLGAWIALVFKGSFALVGLAEYLFIFIQAPLTAMALGAGVLLILVNLVGARASGSLQNVIVAVLLLLMGLYVVWGSFALDIDTLRPLLPMGWSGVLAGTGLVFIAYLGIIAAATISEEVTDPGRSIPRGIIAAVVVVTLLYVVTMVVVTGVLPMDQLLIEAAPVASAAGVFMGGVGLIVMAIAGILATASTGNAAVLGSSRYPFAMARDNLMTSWLNDISSRFGTPVRSILITGGVMLALVLVFDVEQLAKLGSAFNVLVFVLVNLSVILLRRAAPEWYEPVFRVPFVPILPGLGAAASLALLPGMGLLAQVAALLFILGGFGWWHFYRDRGEGRAKPEYGVLDQLFRIREVEALEKKRVALREAKSPSPEPEEVAEARGHVVVELVHGHPNRHILLLASAVARRERLGIDLVVVTEVPYQTPLAAGVQPLDPEWVEKVRLRLETGGTPVRLHNVLARDRDIAVLDAIDADTRLVLVDWHEPLRIHRLRDSHVDVIIRKSPVRVAVLKHRGLDSLKKIAVATGGGPYAKTEVEIADALAQVTGAGITFVRVVRPDAPAARVGDAREYLDSLRRLVESPAEVLLVRDDDVVEGLIEATLGHDLLVIGASNEPRFRRTVFGRIPDRVARQADVSVLVTRDPERPGPLARVVAEQVFREG